MHIRRLNNNETLLLQRNGADFAVFLNTSSEFDGSDSGARPDEAISWGKIRKDANPVKVTILSVSKCDRVRSSSQTILCFSISGIRRGFFDISIVSRRNIC